MAKITISDEFGKSVDFRLSDDSLSMIARFLHYVSFANHSLYDSAASLQKSVFDFYDTDYPESNIQDAKFLRCAINYVLGDLS